MTNTAAPDQHDQSDQPDPLALAQAMSLVRMGDPVTVTPLAGGVSSDIWLLETQAGPFVLKRAREQLKVAAQWHAPVDRGASEAAWLAFVSEHVPGAAPKVLALDQDSFAIALEYLPTEQFSNWKLDLLAGHVDQVFAAKLGRVLGQIHAASTEIPGLDAEFDNADLFEQLRIEPYLRRTATAVPEVASAIAEVITSLETTRLALVHGDFSPKNILVGAEGLRPVILDAETATWGDPAFDVAFCLTHLAIKSVHLPEVSNQLRQEARDFVAAYLAEVTWEQPENLMARVDRILPALVLARVKGASPVEYLNPHEQARVADWATESLTSGQPLTDFLDLEPASETSTQI